MRRTRTHSAVQASKRDRGGRSDCILERATPDRNDFECTQGRSVSLHTTTTAAQVAWQLPLVVPSVLHQPAAE